MPRIPTEQRRLELINAAVEVIAERGVAGATTRLIAERADSPLTMIHYCFGAKEELFFAIFEHLADTHFEQALHVRPGVGLGRAAAVVVRQMGGWLADNDSYARAESELFPWVVRQDNEKARKLYDQTIEVFAAKLRHGMRRDDDTELVDVLARMILAYGDGSVIHDSTYIDRAVRETMLDSMAEALERLADAHRLLDWGDVSSSGTSSVRERRQGASPSP